ncbi:uncharacterized protein LOC144440153 isoform X2 [Glandiceps talaboti]
MQVCVQVFKLVCGNAGDTFCEIVPSGQEIAVNDVDSITYAVQLTMPMTSSSEFHLTLMSKDRDSSDIYRTVLQDIHGAGISGTCYSLESHFQIDSQLGSVAVKLHHCARKDNVSHKLHVLQLDSKDGRIVGDCNAENVITVTRNTLSISTPQDIIPGQQGTTARTDSLEVVDHEVATAQAITIHHEDDDEGDSEKHISGLVIGITCFFVVIVVGLLLVLILVLKNKRRRTHNPVTPV